MYVTRLDIQNFRRFEQVRLQPEPGLNVIIGDNGAGKTSILEALHLMAYGRSFRGRVRDGLIRSGEAAIEVFVEWRDRARAAVDDAAPLPPVEAGSFARSRKAGLRHSGHTWEGRLDGGAVGHLGELCAALAVVTFEPGSHALIVGAGEVRRRYLDWGLFHVEPDFLPLWRRYSRALKQRNALLKARATEAQLDAWEYELAETGEPLGRYREHYLEALQPRFFRLTGKLAPTLGDTRFVYMQGWRRDELSLADALLLARPRDLQAGFTSVGPHRADWRTEFSAIPGREALSRGQAKLTALTALLAQAEHHAAAHGEWPVLCFDDLASELDRRHQRMLLQWMSATGAQVFVTGTELPPALEELGVPFALFHVEQGCLARVR